MTAQAKAKPQLESLTGLRGLAAFYVLLYHLRSGLGQDLPEWMIAFFAKGYLAVDLFFILSGFVMWISYAGKFGQNGIAATPGFLWRRLARIYPLHLILLVAMAGFAILLGLTGRDPGAEMRFSELPYHLLLVQNWGIVDALHWNDPAWSISAEFSAYLIFPLIAIGIDWNRRGLAFIGIGLATLLTMIAMAFYVKGYNNLGDSISDMGVLRCMVQFGIGTALASLWQRRALSFGIALPLGIGIGIAGLVFNISEPFFVPAMLAALMVAVAANDSRLPFLSRGPVHYLGQISYAVYLSHMFLYTLFKLVFVSDVSDIGLVPAAGFIAATLLVSALLFHFVERPAQRWINARRPLSLDGVSQKGLG